MILTIDIGNTHIVTGILDENGTLLLKFRSTSNRALTEDEYFSTLKSLGDFHEINLKKIQGIIVSSVVPSLIEIFQYFGKKYFSMEPIIVSKDLFLPFELNIPTLGADRIINLAQCSLKYPNKNILIFDVGTATTYDILKNNTYLGGGIIPGIQMAINSLSEKTAKLPKIDFKKKDNVIGTNTIDQLESGIYFGYLGQIKNIIEEVKKIIPDIHVISTGGLGNLPLEEINEYLPNISLDGLFTLYNLNKK
ncbi:MAG: type III pantothenate kinase [Cetobacterium sp.]